MNTSSSTRLRKLSSPASLGEHPLAFDIESPSRETSTLDTSTGPGPLLRTLEFWQTSTLPPPPPQGARRRSSLLQRAWQQFVCRMPSSSREASTPNQFLGIDHGGRAPVSEDGIHEVDDSQAGCQNQQQKKQQQKQRSRGTGGSGISSCRSYWVRFKVVGCIVGGALTLDIYLALLGSRAGETPAIGEELSTQRNSTGGSDILLFPLRIGAPSNHSGSMRYHRRSIWDRVADKEDASLLDEHGPPATGTERAYPSSRIRANGMKSPEWETSGKAVEEYFQTLHTRTSSAVDGPDELLVPGENRWGVTSPPPPPLLGSFEGQKVAVVVPYVGKDLPSWWNAFAEQARLNDGLIDWIIFCDQKLVRKRSPSNIRFFPMTTTRMAWLLAAVVDPDYSIHARNGGSWGGDERGNMGSDGVKIPATDAQRQEESKGKKGDEEQEEGDEAVFEVGNAAIENGAGRTTAGYVAIASAESRNRAVAGAALEKNLVKRKRAASILRQLLLTSPYFIVEFKPALGWLFREYLSEYSHWAFGDLDVLFGDMRRGWLEPSELSHFDIITFSFGDQYRAYLRGQLTIHKNTVDVNRLWRKCSHITNYLERLEEFRVNHELPLESAEGCYSVAAASDPSLRIKFTVKALSDVDHENEQAVALHSGREVIIDGHGHVILCPDLGYYYDGPPLTDRWGNDRANEGGVFPSMQDAVGPITSVKRAQGMCEHWIKPEHQTCVENVGANQTLFLIDGEYFKQEFINNAASTGGRDCRAGAFYHFQKIKRNYRSWNSHPAVSPAHFGIAVGPGGIVPLPTVGWRERVSGPGVRPPAEYATKVKYYCLGWTERRQARRQESSRLEQACAVKVSSEEVVVVVDTRRVIGNEKDQSRGDAADPETVTLGSVGDSGDLEAFMSNADEWEGPKIFAMVLDGDELAATREMDALKGAKDVRGGVLVAALLRPPSGPDMPEMIVTFPRKALMNLVADLCDSRYLLSLPGSSRLSPQAFQAVSAQLNTNRQRPPAPSWQNKGVALASRNTAGSGDPRPPLEFEIPGPITLVIPFDKTDEPLPSPRAKLGTGGMVSPGAESGDIHNSRNKELRSVSAKVGAATAGEDAAAGDDLVLGHARVALDSARVADEVAESAATDGENAAASAFQAVVEASAADGGRGDVGWRGGDGLAPFGDSGSDVGGEYTSSKRGVKRTSDIETYSGGVGGGSWIDSVEATVGTKRTGIFAAATIGQREAMPLQIFFLAPAYGGTSTLAEQVATSDDTGNVSGSDDEAASTAFGGMTMTSWYKRRHQGPTVNSHGRSIAFQSQVPLDNPSRPRPTQQQQQRRQQRQRRQQPQRHLPILPKGGYGRVVRGGRRGRRNIKTTADSAFSSLIDSFGGGEVHSARNIRTPIRRLGSLIGDSVMKKGQESSASGNKSDEAVAASEVVEAEWVREMLLSGPGGPGLVVDLWSPGPMFLRHVEEFGDDGCMDAAYAIGLWRAGSSFQVVKGASVVSAASGSPTPQSEAYVGDRRVFTPEGTGHHFLVPGGACLRNEAASDTASIYSTFLLQVASVYRHPRSGGARRD